MKTIKLVFLSLAFSTISVSQTNFSSLLSGKWIDLTYSFEENTVYWPTNEPYKHETIFEGITEKGYFYSSYKFSAEEHGGTHFDAPVHFGQGKNSIEKVPVNTLMGEAIVVDVSAQSAKDRDYRVSIDDFLQWEKNNGKLSPRSIVLIRTGFGKYYPDRLKYTGTELKGTVGVDNLHFPGLSGEAAAWLAEERKILSVGLDTPSIDYGQSKMFEAHRVLCAHDITIYENVANLQELPAKGAFVVALPMKIKGGSGAPLRIIALVP